MIELCKHMGYYYEPEWYRPHRNTYVALWTMYSHEVIWEYDCDG